MKRTRTETITGVNSSSTPFHIHITHIVFEATQKALYSENFGVLSSKKAILIYLGKNMYRIFIFRGRRATSSSHGRPNKGDHK